jgi:alpha-mannosidase
MLNRGLPEVGVKRGAEGVEMALTLLRAVGWIARLHWAVAGYRIPTPEAQCLGKQTFQYALVPHAGDWRSGRVWEQAQAFAFPPAAYDAMPGEGTKAEASLLSVTPSEMVVGAIKKAEKGEDLIVRLWNVAPETVAAGVTFGFPVGAAWIANMNEDPLEALQVADGQVSFAAGPCKIVTLRVTPAE